MHRDKPTPQSHRHSGGLIHNFEFSCSFRASFSVIQGEGWHRSYFWAGLWVSFASSLTAVLTNIPSLRSALAVFECCYGGCTWGKCSEGLCWKKPLRKKLLVCLSWQDVETEGSINIKGSFRWFQALISSYQLVKPGDKPNSLVMTAIIIRHLLCSLCSLYPGILIQPCT